MKRVVVMAWIGWCCLGSAVAEEAVEAQQVVRQAADQVLACLSDRGLGEDVKRERILGIIQPVFDFPLMSMLSVGKRSWGVMTPEQRKRFSDLFARQMENSYLSGVALFSDERVTVDEAVKVGDKVQVGTTVLSKGEDTKVLYKLHRAADGWRVYDFEIEGVSIISSYRSQYAQALAKGDVDELLTRMQERIQERVDERQP